MSQAMEAGTRWSLEIAQRLQDCNAGLILVTNENSHEPWLHFEAGALSKQIAESQVVPLLCGASVGSLQGTPLSQFQAKSLEHDEFLGVCISFGAAFDISEEVIRRRFERGWHELKNAVDGRLQKTTEPVSELKLADLMSVLERLSGQVAKIDNAVRRKAEPVTRGMFGHRAALPTDYSLLGQIITGENSKGMSLPPLDAAASERLGHLLMEAAAVAAAKNSEQEGDGEKQ